MANFPPGDLLVGDFNGDGKLDVIVPITQGSFNTPTLLEFLGNGDGSFAASRTMLTDAPIGSSLIAGLFTVVDLNHDGRTDLIEQRGLPGQTAPAFRIFLAQPDGSFVLTNTYSPYSGIARSIAGGSAPVWPVFCGRF